MTPPRDCIPLLEHHGLHEMARWASSRPIRHGWKGRTCRDLWDAAPRGDWLLYWAESAEADRRDLVRAVAACARPALRFVQEGDPWPRTAIEAAERWADRPTKGHLAKALLVARHAWQAEMDRTGPAVGAAAASAVRAAAGVAEVVDATNVAWASARRAAQAHLSAGGQDAEAAAHRACADEVRRLVPFIDLHL